MNNLMQQRRDIPEQPGERLLAKEALDLMSDILKSWSQLDQLVQAEWKAVLRGEFTSLYRFSRGKEILCDHITRSEKELKLVLEEMVAGGSSVPGNTISRLLCCLSFEHGKRLMAFHIQRANLKIKVAITNRRTMTWVKERLDFSNELMEILSGNRLRKTATYLPPGKSIAYRRERDIEMLTRQSRSQGLHPSRVRGNSARQAGRYPGVQPGK